MKISGPLFKWFGSKWQSGKGMPSPKHDIIVEPFAGGAGYSLRYAEKKVILCEADPHLFKLWSWLIEEAKQDDIRNISIGLSVGTDIRTLGLSDGKALLLKSWQRTNNVGNCWTISPWGNLPGQWTENTRARVSEEFLAIKHWKISPDGLKFMQENNDVATWFVDPPYQFNYQYGSSPIDYKMLGDLLKDRNGQTIVCEAKLGDPIYGNIVCVKKQDYFFIGQEVYFLLWRFTDPSINERCFCKIEYLSGQDKS